jgi:hypothetical protein
MIRTVLYGGVKVVKIQSVMVEAGVVAFLAACPQKIQIRRTNAR